jgi:Ca-activated chloride channel family protein
MNDQKISPDDPKLTAYALGEMPLDERAEFEAALRHDSAAQATVTEIRALAGQLEAALAHEPLGAPVIPFESSTQFSGSNRSGEPLSRQSLDADDPYRRRKVVRFPYVIIGSALAACFAVVFALRGPTSATSEQAQKNYPVPSAQAEAKTRADAQAEEADLESRKRKSKGIFALDAGVLAKSAPVYLVQDAAEATALAAPTSPMISLPVDNSNKAQIVSENAKGVVSTARQMSKDEFDARMAVRADKPRVALDTEAYAHTPDSEFFRVKSAPLSTFSIDVDTASYANVRRFLENGRLPPSDAVRLEELVNYFTYAYAPPAKEAAAPFAASIEIADAPWNPAHRLVRIGLKGREIPAAERPALNLVFLLDVSGSMNEPNKLPLVKASLRSLVGTLRADDRVAIVTYAGASGLALPSTPAARKRDILDALDALNPGGSTDGAMGIQLAYDIAKANFVEAGANRVILCTDGDFNVGVTSDGELTRLIEEKAKSGVFLTVLGFGMGNYKDATLERLADKGNGNYGYIDSAAEARKLLVEQAGGTLVTIAKDVKLQVEFNPAVAQAYRLIGYENRALKKEDFNNDKVDAGEIGAGHTVTALYEVVPVGAPAPETVPDVDPLKYQSPSASDETAADSKAETAAERVAARRRSVEEMLTLKIRYKEPKVDVSRKIEIPAIDTGVDFAAASKDFKFAAAVAGLGMILRDSAHKGAADYDRVLSWAEAGRGADLDGRRGEFIALVQKARALAVQ